MARKAIRLAMVQAEAAELRARRARAVAEEWERVAAEMWERAEAQRFSPVHPSQDWDQVRELIREWPHQVRRAECAAESVWFEGLAAAQVEAERWARPLPWEKADPRAPGESYPTREATPPHRESDD